MLQVVRFLFCSFAAVHAVAAIRLEQNILTVETASLVMKLDQGAVVSLRNRLSAEEYIERPGPRWLDMTHGGLEDAGIPADPLEPSSWRLANENGIERAVLEVSGPGRAVTMTIEIANDEIVVRLAGRSDHPGVISVTWGIFGLQMNPGHLVIPGQAGTYFDHRSDVDIVGLDYPVHWEHQMSIYEGAKGSLLLYCADEALRYKRLHASREVGALDMAIELFATAPFGDAKEVVESEWHLTAFSGGWKEPAARYKAHMNAKYPPVEASGAREWIHQIRGTVIFLTNELELLDRVAKELIPSRTLIHLIDWRKHAFDIYYPDYSPSDAARKFVAHAHELGFRVMLHTNAFGVSETHPLYAKFSRFQMRRANTLQRIGWLWDEFPEGHPRRVAYISPASAEFRREFVDSIRSAIEELKPDAIHLDAGGAIINDGNGLVDGMNSMEGSIQLHKDLIAAYPDIVWGGESTNEIIGPYNWLAQRWASDYPAHPIGNYLMGDQVFFYGFLDQPTADEPEYVQYLKRYELQGVLPAVAITSASDLGADRKHTFQLLRRLRRWQEKQYRPDWSSDWGTSLFRFRSEDGSSLADVEASENVVRLVEDGETLYERVRGLNRVTTERFIDRWPAFDESTLVGLDPTREYWLTPDSRPDSSIHLRQIPANFRVGTGSLVHPRFGYFELEAANRPWFDFIAALGAAKKGTLYEGRDYGLVFGASVSVGRTVVGGEQREAALIALPPSRWNFNGATFVEYKVNVPDVPNIALHFEAGIADSDGRSDGVLFGVQLNGSTVWRQTVGMGGWVPGSVDLTPFAGTDVLVRFLTYAGTRLNAWYDWACFASLRLEAGFTMSSASVTLGLPDGVSVEEVSGGTFTMSGNRAEASVSLPGSFVAFLEKPKAIHVGETLLDLPYDVWKSNYQGIPYRFSVEGSGEIEEAVSGGVLREKALIAIPPRNGATIITTTVTIPEEASSLVVDYGLTDPPTTFGPDFEYTGAEFSMQINGDVVFSEEVRSRGWMSQRIPLEPYRGKSVLIQLKTDSLTQAIYDWARWANLAVE